MKIVYEQTSLQVQLNSCNFKREFSIILVYFIPLGRRYRCMGIRKPKISCPI